MITLAIITPCLNEEEVLPISAKRLLEIMDNLCKEGLISPKSRLIAVDDGSTDTTWKVIEDLHAKDPRVGGVKLAHNCGHQAALLAGMFVARDFADATVTIDSDLQDDPDAIYEMVRKHAEGAEVVYGVRNNRDTDTFLKRTTAHAFYAFMRLIGSKVIPDHADFRLMGIESMRKLASYGEEDIYFRALVPKLGFPEAKVYYARAERAAGEPSYTFWKSAKLALGILGEYTGIKKRRSSRYEIGTTLM